MAQYLFVARTRALGLPAMALSMGTLGLVARSAAREAIEVCAEQGIDLNGHRSQGLNPAILRAATHIFVMEEAHRDHVLRLSPEIADRVHLLGAWDPESPSDEIADPVQLPLEVFRTCRDQLARAIDAFLSTEGVR